MAKSRTVTMPIDPAPVILGYSTEQPGRYAGPRPGAPARDEYGFHFRRVLPCRQEILYTVTPSGLLVEKVNFIPSKGKRDGNAAYGRRWLAVLQYRQSADYVADLELAAANGMAMDPPAKSGGASPTAGRSVTI